MKNDSNNNNSAIIAVLILVVIGLVGWFAYKQGYLSGGTEPTSTAKPNIQINY